MSCERAPPGLNFWPFKRCLCCPYEFSEHHDKAMSTKIVYLDQNKWIALAKAAKNPDEKSEARSALEFLVNERKAGRVLLPLTATNVYETHKINNRRAALRPRLLHDDTG
jgi:hypothetical protein